MASTLGLCGPNDADLIKVCLFYIVHNGTAYKNEVSAGMNVLVQNLIMLYPAGCFGKLCQIICVSFLDVTDSLGIDVSW